MPDGGEFTTVDISKYTLPATVTNAYKASNGGFVVKLLTKGFDQGMVILCGVDENGVVTGAKCLESKETLGHEKTYGENFVGLALDGVRAVDTISSATKTTSAYRAAIVDAINATTILGGGEADLRTEEEIFRDNLAAALPSAEGKLTRLFLMEELFGVKAIYTADNGSGSVYLIGSKMIGITAGGEFVGEVSDADKATVMAAEAILKASSKAAVDLSSLKLAESVQSVEKTASGNYIFKLHAKGITYAYPEWYTPTPIVILVSMTSSGQIIDVDTLSQGESEGYGDACAKDSFTDRFIGKFSGSYQTIDGISGSTITTNGYLAAIGDAYDALELLAETEFIDISTLALPDAVQSVEKTKDGSYKFILYGKGITYAYPEWYTPTPIVIALTLTEDGKILSCKTLSQGESAGYGDACASEDFTNRFTDKTKENYREVDGISGSTITTNGYLDAIGAAYTALEKLVGRETVDISRYDPPESVKAIEKTGAGEYVFTLHAKGITYDPALSQWYTPTPIVIALTMTPDGKILSCKTVSQGESQGYGDACASESFTGQFTNKNKDTFRGVDGISGSTVTTTGYLNAIGDAYTAYELLKGGDGQ